MRLAAARDEERRGAVRTGALREGIDPAPAEVQVGSNGPILQLKTLRPREGPDSL